MSFVESWFTLFSPFHFTALQIYLFRILLVFEENFRLN